MTHRNQSPLAPTEELSAEELLEAVEAAERRNDLPALNVALGTLGRALLRTGQTLPALARFEQGLKVAQQLDDRESGARHLANQGLALAQIGNYGLAVRAMRKAHNFAQQLQHEPLLYETVLQLAELELARQSPESALGLLEEALQIAERRANVPRQARVRIKLGEVYWRLEEYTEAEAHYQAALRMSADAGEVEAQRDCLHDLGVMARSRGQAAQAAAHFRQALDLQPADQNRSRYLSLVSNLGGSALDLEEFPAAQAAYEKALELARSLGDRPAEVRALGGLSLVEAERDHANQSLALATEAVEAARTLEQPQLLGEQLMILAFACQNLGQIEAAQAACGEAIETFQTIEASSLLEKASDLMKQISRESSASEDT